MRRKNFWDFVSISIMAVLLVMMLNSFQAEAAVVRGNTLNGYYPHMGRVTRVIKKKKRGIYKITAKDANGNLWSWRDDARDWFRGDFVAFIMNDNGTKKCVYDDQIIDARYVGVKKFF